MLKGKKTKKHYVIYNLDIKFQQTHLLDFYTKIETQCQADFAF